MIIAYSRLEQILAERGLTVPELHRRLQEREIDVNIKSLYRLNDAAKPLAKLDLRIAGAICQLCEVTVADLVDFAKEGTRLENLPEEKQSRLDALLDKNNEGRLTKRERRELQELVRETQAIALRNARTLASHQRRLGIE